MEGFLYTLGLTGPVAEYVKSLAKGGFYSPEDLLMMEPSINDLAGLGITNPRDLNLIHSHICPEGDAEEEPLEDNPYITDPNPSDLDFGIDLNDQPDFDVDPNEPEMNEDDYEKMKREYELLMGGGGMSLEEEPLPERGS